MACPRHGDNCNEYYCGGNDGGKCVAGDDARVSDFMAAHDMEIRRQTIDELLYGITEGLDDGIRCALCTNTMKSDRGCDGSCVVDDSMYEKVMEVIIHNLQYAEQMKGEAHE